MLQHKHHCCSASSHVKVFVPRSTFPHSAITQRLCCCEQLAGSFSNMQVKFLFCAIMFRCFIFAAKIMLYFPPILPAFSFEFRIPLLFMDVVTVYYPGEELCP
jgi:hypothetical protein